MIPSLPLDWGPALRSTVLTATLLPLFLALAALVGKAGKRVVRHRRALARDLPDRLRSAIDGTGHGASGMHGR